MSEESEKKDFMGEAMRKVPSSKCCECDKPAKGAAIVKNSIRYYCRSCLGIHERRNAFSATRHIP